jgi:hypothetical protein
MVWGRNDNSSDSLPFFCREGAPQSKAANGILTVYAGVLMSIASCPKNLSPAMV